MRVLIIDNNDSFTHNLTQLVAGPGIHYAVVPNWVNLATINEFNPTHIILSPGPGTVESDEDFGVSRAVLRRFSGRVPILGVCLGHQGIGYEFGMRIIRAREICHGKIRRVTTVFPSVLFEGLPQSFPVMRYHSMAVEPTRQSDRHLIVTSVTDDGTIMSLEHRFLSVFGIQYHPESISTTVGGEIMRRFLSQKGGLKTVTPGALEDSGEKAA